MCIGQDLIVPESQNAVAHAFQIIGPKCIFAVLGHMLAAVCLNDQPCLKAGEVNDIRFYNQLPSKLESGHTVRSQVIPKQFLCFRRLLAQISSELLHPE